MSNRIKGLTVEIGGDTTGLSKSLKTVQSTIKTTESTLKDVNKLLKLDPKNTELLSQKQKLLATDISTTKEKLEALKTAQEQAKEQLEKGELGQDKYDALQREIVETEQELQRLQKEADNTNTVFDKMDKAGASMQSVGDKITSVGKKLSVASTAVAGLGLTAIKTTASFDESMSKVSAVSGAAGDDLQALRDKAREMGAKTKFSASEAGDAMNYMAMAGWKAKDMISGVEGIMNLAAASGEDLATTSDIVTDALTAFGLTAKDSTRFADILAAASSNANTNVSMLGESFKFCAPLAGSMGYSTEDVSVALGLMANSGIKASQAGTSLRSILTNLAKPSKEVGTAMDQLGLTITNEVGEMKPLNILISELRNSFKSLTQEQKAQYAKTLAGKQGMSGFLAIINASEGDVDKLTEAIYGSWKTTDSFNEEISKTGNSLDDVRKAFSKIGVSGENFDFALDMCSGSAEIFNEYINEMADGSGTAEDVLQSLGMTTESLQGIMDNSSGSAQSMAETMQDNLTGQLTILKSQMEELAISFGEILMPTIRKIVTAVQGFVDKLNSMDDSQREMILKIGLVVAAAGPLLLIVGKVTSSLGSALQMVSKLGKSLMTLSSNGGLVHGVMAKIGPAIAGISGPVVAVVAVIGALIAAFVHLWNTNDGFKKNILDTWEKIKTTVSEFAQGVVEKVNSLGFNFKDISELIKTVWNGLCSVLAPVFEGAFNNILNILSTVLGVIQNVFGVFVSIFNGDWSGAWESVKGIFETLWNGISGIFTTDIEMIKGVADTVLSWFGTTWNSVWTSVSTFFTNIWSKITTFFSNAWESIKNAVSVGIQFIGAIFKTAFDIITLPFRFIWENCKDTVMAIWEKIKTAVSGAISKVSETISSIMNSIKSVFSAVWDAISSKVTAVVNKIKDVVSKVFNSIKSFVGPIWNNIKTTITGVVDRIKEKISAVFTSVKSSISNVFNSIHNTASSVWNKIKTAITGPVESAKNTVKSAVDKIKGFFDNIKLKLPHIDLPHFSVEGKLSLNPPSVPKLKIDWYREGGIMTSPTIFGMSGTSLMAGGEAGHEAILPLAEFYDKLSNMLDNKLNYGFMEKYLKIIAENSKQNLVLDTGALVGNLMPEIDTGLANYSIRRKRGNR